MFIAECQRLFPFGQLLTDRYDLRCRLLKWRIRFLRKVFPNSNREMEPRSELRSNSFAEIIVYPWRRDRQERKHSSTIRRSSGARNPTYDWSTFIVQVWRTLECLKLYMPWWSMAIKVSTRSARTRSFDASASVVFQCSHDMRFISVDNPFASVACYGKLSCTTSFL